MKNLLAVLILTTSMLMCGCASVSTDIFSQGKVDSLETFYVQQRAKDNRQIDKVISDQLTLMGFRSTNGSSETPPEPVDAIVTYQDKWWWDITMYMVELNIQVRDSQNRAVVASGRSYRPSLQRKSPEAMAREILSDIFKKQSSVTDTH